MTIAATVPANGSGSDTTGTTSYTTGSIAFVNGRSYVLATCATGTSSATPTVSGTGTGTWGATTPTSVSFNPVSGTTTRLNGFLYHCAGDVTETLSIVYGSSRTNCLWIVAEITGQDTSGFLVQGDAANSNSVTSVQGMTNNAMSLAAFADAVNNGLLLFVAIANNSNISAAGSLSELGEVSDAAPNFRLAAYWQVGEDTTPDATFTSSNAGALAFELKAAASAGQPYAMRATGVPGMDTTPVVFGGPQLW